MKSTAKFSDSSSEEVFYDASDGSAMMDSVLPVCSQTRLQRGAHKDSTTDMNLRTERLSSQSSAPSLPREIGFTRSPSQRIDLGIDALGSSWNPSMRQSEENQSIVPTATPTTLLSSSRRPNDTVSMASADLTPLMPKVMGDPRRRRGTGSPFGSAPDEIRSSGSDVHSSSLPRMNQEPSQNCDSGRHALTVKAIEDQQGTGSRSCSPDVNSSSSNAIVSRKNGNVSKGICPRCQHGVVLWVANRVCCHVLYETCPGCALNLLNDPNQHVGEERLAQILESLEHGFKILVDKLSLGKAESNLKRIKPLKELIELDMNDGKSLDTSSLTQIMKLCIDQIQQAFETYGTAQGEEKSRTELLSAIQWCVDEFKGTQWEDETMLSFFDCLIVRVRSLMLRYEHETSPTEEEAAVLNDLLEKIVSTRHLFGTTVPFNIDQNIEECVFCLQSIRSLPSSTSSSESQDRTSRDPPGQVQRAKEIGNESGESNGHPVPNQTPTSNASDRNLKTNASDWMSSPLRATSGKMRTPQVQTGPHRDASSNSMAVKSAERKMQWRSSQISRPQNTSSKNIVPIRSTRDPSKVPHQPNGKDEEQRMTFGTRMSQFAELMEHFCLLEEQGNSRESSKLLQKIVASLKVAGNVGQSLNYRFLHAVLKSMERWSNDLGMLILCLDTLSVVVVEVKASFVSAVATSITRVMNTNKRVFGIQYSGCRAICRLLETSKMNEIDGTTQKQLVDAIINSMSVLEAKSRPQTEACRSLWQLARLGNHGMLVTAGCISEIIKALKNHPQEKSLQCAGCAVLGDLAYDRAKYVLSANGIKVLLAAIENFSGVSGIVHTALGALKNIACENAAKCTELLCVEAMKIILSGMRKHDLSLIRKQDLSSIQVHERKVAVQRQGLGLIVQLASHDPFLELLGTMEDSDGMDVILAPIASLLDDADVQLLGCIVLCKCAGSERQDLRPATLRGVDLVVRTMESHRKDPDINQHGCTFFAQLAEDKSSRDYLFHSKALPKIMITIMIAILNHSDSRDVQYYGYAAFSKLSADYEDLRLLICSTDQPELIGSLLQSVRKHVKDDKLVQNATDLLSDLTRNEEVISMIAERASTGFVQAIIESMEKQPSLEFQKNSLHLIYRLAEMQRELLSFSVIDAILKSMSLFPDDAELQSYGCSALWSVAVSVNNILGGAVLQPVFSALHAHAENADVQSSGFKVLSLVATAKGGTLLSDRMDSLLASIDYHKADSRVIRDACALLSVISTDAELVCHPAKASKLIRAVIAAMAHQKQVVQIQTDGCRILDKLASSEELLELIVRLDAVKMIDAVLRKFKKRKELVGSALGALTKFSMSFQGQKDLLRLRTDRAVLEALNIHFNNTTLQLTGYLALAKMWTNPELVTVTKKMVQTFKRTLKAQKEDAKVVSRMFDTILILTESQDNRRMMLQEKLDRTIERVQVQHARLSCDSLLARIKNPDYRERQEIRSI